jgi:hypothetical protein
LNVVDLRVSFFEVRGDRADGWPRDFIHDERKVSPAVSPRLFRRAQALRSAARDTEGNDPTGERLADTINAITKVMIEDFRGIDIGMTGFEPATP